MDRLRPLILVIALAAFAALVMRSGPVFGPREPLVAKPGEAKAVLQVRGMT